MNFLYVDMLFFSLQFLRLCALGALHVFFPDTPEKAFQADFCLQVTFCGVGVAVAVVVAVDDIVGVGVAVVVASQESRFRRQTRR